MLFSLSCFCTDLNESVLESFVHAVGFCVQLSQFGKHVLLEFILFSFPLLLSLSLSISLFLYTGWVNKLLFVFLLI